MSALVFGKFLPTKLIQLINQYLYYPKDQDFIKRWMYTLMHSKQLNIGYWKLLIRDSSETKLTMEEKQINSSFNFTQFILNTIPQQIKCKQVAGRELQIFCTQAILNNPQIVFNRYDSLYGLKYNGFSTYHLIATYLINRSVNGFTVNKCEQMQESMFKLLNFIIYNEYYTESQTKYIFHSIKSWSYITSKTSQTLKLILNYRKIKTSSSSLTSSSTQTTNNIVIDDEDKMLNCNFMQSLFRVYIGLTQNYLRNQPQHHRSQKQSVKQVSRQILTYINNNHPQIIYQIQQFIQDTVIYLRNPDLLSLLLSLQIFNKILISEYFIFTIFQQRFTKFIYLIWQNQGFRERISLMKISGRNILEHTCDSFGLVHNIILRLWNSKLFPNLPKIRNKKSQKIVHNTLKK